MSFNLLYYVRWWKESSTPRNYRNFRSGTCKIYPASRTRGGSRGRVQGVRIPPPRDDLRFSNKTGILPKKKTMWFIGVEVEQETSAPPPKKNPRSAPRTYLFMMCTGVWEVTFTDNCPIFYRHALRSRWINFSWHTAVYSFGWRWGLQLFETQIAAKDWTKKFNIQT